MKRTNFLALSCLLPALGVCAAEPLIDHVDLHFGVNHGKTIAGPCLPNGSIHPAPESLEDARTNGYTVGREVVGFAQLHAQGTGGVTTYGNFLVTPRIGMSTREADHASKVKDAIAGPAMYSSMLERWGIGVRMAPARHVAVYEFSFPESDDAHILMDVGRKIGGEPSLAPGEVRIDPKTRRISGGGHFTNFWESKPHVYFCAEVDTDFTEYGTWVDDEVNKGSTWASIREMKRIGGYLKFATEAGQKIRMKVAVSMHSPDRAASYLDREAPGWDVDAVAKAAHSEWAELMSGLEIEGADDATLKRLATALYHTNTQPRDRTGDFAKFPADKPMFDDHYTLWDTYKTLYPLQSILRPEHVGRVVNSFIERAKANPNGYVATAFIGGYEGLVGQGGNTVDKVVCDAWARGVPGVDWNEAYGHIMKHNADRMRTEEYRTLGWAAQNERGPYSWRFGGGSGTLAFSYEDDCASRMAAALGHADDAARYAARSHNWENVFNKDAGFDGFKGFIIPRNKDGSWASLEGERSSDIDKEGFYEGTPWVYSFHFFHDIDRLVAAMGGKETFIKRLEYAFDHDLLDFSNEPSFQTPWLPCHPEIRRPDLAAKLSERLFRAFPKDGYPGDEDNGAMSSLLIFLYSGMYPQVGTDRFHLSGPRLPKMTFNQTNGKRFSIIGKDAGPDNLYIQSATLNGQPLNDPWITQSQIRAGGELKIAMGPVPSRWGFGD